jgi:hypothetical protein
LKAYLAKLGATPEHLKYEFGHKLDELVTEAVEKSLDLTTKTQEEIKLLNEAHSKFWHRYPIGRRQDRSLRNRAIHPRRTEGT